MARPRRLKHPVKINLMVDKYIKNQAAEMARKQGISVGRLFENWVLKDLNGSLPADDELLDDELSEEF
jgi:predicted HicB family RNase H-like nuclease